MYEWLVPFAIHSTSLTAYNLWYILCVMESNLGKYLGDHRSMLGHPRGKSPEREVLEPLVNDILGIDRWETWQTWCYRNGYKSTDSSAFLKRYNGRV